MPTPRPSADPINSPIGEDKSRKKTLDSDKVGHRTQSGHASDMYKRDESGEYVGDGDSNYGGAPKADLESVNGGSLAATPRQSREANAKATLVRR